MRSLIDPLCLAEHTAFPDYSGTRALKAWQLPTVDNERNPFRGLREFGLYPTLSLPRCGVLTTNTGYVNIVRAFIQVAEALYSEINKFIP